MGFIKLTAAVEDKPLIAWVRGSLDMRKTRLAFGIVLIFAVAACRGEDNGFSGAGTAFETLKSKFTVRPAPAPSPTPAPTTTSVTSSPSSLMPYIDVAKIPAPNAGFADKRIRATTDLPSKNADGSGQFRVVCQFSHMSFDDPIVFPGKQGAAHLHAFFGNTAVNYASTQTSIETTGNSTCSGGTANRTGYWVPAIIDTKDGAPLKPSTILVYYKGDILGGANVKPFPAGLRMIAGDMKSSAPQAITDWGCIAPSGAEQRYTSIPANCPIGFIVETTINFPMCWDGVNLDSPDHKSHMAYVGWNNDLRVNMCPTSHPVLLPQLTEKVRYQVTEEGSTARWRLASDNYSKDLPGGYSIHADWFNGWDPKVQETWVKNCLNAMRDCHADLLGDGTTLF